MNQGYKITIVKNKSTTYLLPLIAKQIDFDDKYKLLNSYLSFEEGDDVFSVIYKWSSSPEYLKFEGKLMKNHLFIGHQDYGNHTVYKFRLSIAMKAGRDKFIKGNIKGFSDDHKEAVIEYLKKINAKNIERIKLMLTPGSQLYSTAPDMEKETLVNSVKEIKLESDTFQ